MKDSGDLAGWSGGFDCCMTYSPGGLLLVPEFSSFKVNREASRILNCSSQCIQTPEE